MFTFIAILCSATLMAQAVPFTVVETGGQSGVETRREVVIRSAEEWKALRIEHAPGERPSPRIDFTTSMVIGVFLGTRPTGGHAVEISAIERDGNGLMVTYRERRPGPDEIATQVITTPFQLVTTAKVAGRVRFTRAR